MKYHRFAGASLLLCACSFSLPAQVVISPADLANLKQVSDPQISPSGKEVAYVVTTPVDPGKHKSAHIWIAATGEAATSVPFISATQATQHRDGRRMAAAWPSFRIVRLLWLTRRQVHFIFPSIMPEPAPISQPRRIASHRMTPIQVCNSGSSLRMVERRRR